MEVLKLRRKWVAQEEKLCQGKVEFFGSLGGEGDSTSALPTIVLGSVLLQRALSGTLETINHSQGFVKNLAFPYKLLVLGYWQLWFFFKVLNSTIIFHTVHSKTLTEEERILKSCLELQGHQCQRHEHKSASATSCSDVLHNGLTSRQQFCFSSWEALYFVNFSLCSYPWLFTFHCYSWGCADVAC